MFLSDLSIRRPVFATMMILALVVLGVFSYRRLSIDQWPNVEFPFISIETQYPGASPEAVEREVTKRIEEAVNSAEGLKKIQSYSNEGYSTIWLQFELDVDANVAQSDVRAKVDAVRRDLPRDIDPPVISRFDTQSYPIMSYAVEGEGWSLRDLTRLAEETVSRRLENIRGVGSVSVAGGVRREIHAFLLPGPMEALGVSPDMVTAALARENTDIPAGRVDRGAREDLVRVKGRVRAPADLERVVVAVRDGAPVRLSQVARIEDAAEEERDAAFLDGRRAVAVEIRKASGGNTVDIADAVEAEVARLNQELPPGVHLRGVRDDSMWIRRSVEDVRQTLVEGAMLTVFIVFLFLASWRSTVITGLTLPVSVISAFIAIYAFGFTLNNMTLMALSLVIGVLIDDAIVVRENIVRHLERGEDHFTAARRGTSEIGLAVLATSLSIMSVFVPVAFMGGIVGKFFYAFGITVTFAVMVSLFVSFTVDPMLSSRWYDPQAEGVGRPGLFMRPVAAFSHFFDRVTVRYRGVVAWALRHRGPTLGIAAAAFLATLGLMATGLVGGQMFPNSDEEEIALVVDTPVGSSLDYTARRSLEVVDFLKTHPEVAYAYTTIGGSQQFGAVNRGMIYVKLTPKKSRARTQDELSIALRGELSRFAGINARVMQLGFGGAQAPIQLNIKGPDIQELERLSANTIETLRGIPGLVELKSSLEGEKPEWVVDVRRDLASDLGLSVGAIGSALRPVLAGEKAGDWEDETGLSHDVVVRLAPEARTSRQDLARIPIATGHLDPATGNPVMVPLGAVATLRMGGAPDQVNRLDLSRVATIEGNYQGHALTKVTTDVKRRLAATPLPPGYRYDFSGEEEDYRETVGYMVESLVLAIVFIYLILASQFGSFLQPLAIMFSLPLSLVGVMAALILTRGSMNIMSMIGIIMLMGLVTKNAILLVDFTNQARARGLDRSRALIEAGATRLRPIMMTTLAMIFGMLPTALARGAGSEFRAPMAHAVIGGLITSTLLTLVVVPVVYTLLDGMGGRAGRLIRRWTSAPSETSAPETRAPGTEPLPEEEPLAPEPAGPGSRRS